VFATVLPHDVPGDKFIIYSQEFEQHGKKVVKASRVLAFEGMFIEQHTFLVIKSEIKQLFIFLCISYITLKLLLAGGLLIWTQRLFVL
jgi:hypothetical protein